MFPADSVTVSLFRARADKFECRDKLECVCVCVVSVVVKRPVLPPSVVDGRSRNPLYYYYTQCRCASLMLQVNRTLTKLDISSNRVDWDCAPYLARALAINRSLEVLEVSTLTQALKGTRGEQSSRALSIGVSFNHMLLECQITTELFTKNG